MKLGCAELEILVDVTVEMSNRWLALQFAAQEEARLGSQIREF